ncbi:uncharacterized protein LOC116174037 [Photinus pyralis]|uniref:uncharacterized protein LOC116174037 n=1 Tax=Photinus pyralis TaxID=7054 RepID=UPI0012672FDA|nr:uncharacterized protein LOC116174037 [Photinus pyralis]
MEERFDTLHQQLEKFSVLFDFVELSNEAIKEKSLVLQEYLQDPRTGESDIDSQELCEELESLKIFVTGQQTIKANWQRDEREKPSFNKQDVDRRDSQTSRQIVEQKGPVATSSNQGLGGAKVPCNTMADLVLQIDSNNHNVEAIVVPNEVMTVNVVLGRDFLQNVQWEFNEKGILFKQKEVMAEVYSIMNIQVDNNDIDLNINPGVEEAVKCQVKRLITECVKNGDNTNASESVLKLKIDLRNDKPVRCAPRRLAYHEHKIVDDIIRDLLNKNIIRPSSSEYSSPVVLVKKKTGESRMCVDYRELNKNVIKDCFPLPVIDDLINRLASAQYLTTLDLKNGFLPGP